MGNRTVGTHACARVAPTRKECKFSWTDTCVGFTGMKINVGFVGTLVLVGRAGMFDSDLIFALDLL